MIFIFLLRLETKLILVAWNFLAIILSKVSVIRFIFVKSIDRRYWKSSNDF